MKHVLVAGARIEQRVQRFRPTRDHSQAQVLVEQQMGSAHIGVWRAWSGRHLGEALSAGHEPLYPLRLDGTNPFRGKRTIVAGPRVDGAARREWRGIWQRLGTHRVLLEARDLRRRQVRVVHRDARVAPATQGEGRGIDQRRGRREHGQPVPLLYPIVARDTISRCQHRPLVAGHPEPIIAISLRSSARNLVSMAETSIAGPPARLQARRPVFPPPSSSPPAS